MSWIFHTPHFEYETEYPDLHHYSAWVGHRRFAYDLVQAMQPKTLVELGTHWGISYFSMCQAVKDGQLNTRCYAVDSWLGDMHTGEYPVEVYSKVKHIAARYYGSHAILLRSSFDDALTRFEDESIDLLHIDGCHTYEAVNHDLQAWLPKLAHNGVILFHDIMATHSDFGVYKLWAQLRHWPQLEFHHSYGLGVLFPKGVPPTVMPWLAMNDRLMQMYASE